MATIECPRCETTFETKATTATRCRACRSVVQPEARASTCSCSTTTAWSTEATDAGSGVLLLAAGLVLLALVGYGIYRYVRERRQKVTEQVPGAPLPPYDQS